MTALYLKHAPTAHRFHPEHAPHRLAVQGAKASSNGALLIPAIKVLGYDQTVWGVKTAHGSKEVREGDWIVEHPVFGVLVLTDEEFTANFSTGH